MFIAPKAQKLDLVDLNRKQITTWKYQQLFKIREH